MDAILGGSDPVKAGCGASVTYALQNWHQERMKKQAKRDWGGHAMHIEGPFAPIEHVFYVTSPTCIRAICLKH